MNRTQKAPVTIRGAGPADLPALRDFFAGLSPDTRILRFFGAITPGRAMLARLCGEGGTTDAVVAAHGGVIVGHAMAVDLDPAPGSPVADIGVVVADAWQGRGVGSALMSTLVSRAQARGVTGLSMDVLPGNRRVLAMIAGHWEAARTRRAADCLTVHVPLPALQDERAQPAAPGQPASARPLAATAA